MTFHGKLLVAISALAAGTEFVMINDERNPEEMRV
jgi:hypothetical protein